MINAILMYEGVYLLTSFIAATVALTLALILLGEPSGLSWTSARPTPA